MSETMPQHGLLHRAADGRFDGAIVAVGVLALCLWLLVRNGILVVQDSAGFIGAADALGLPGGLMDGSALRSQPIPLQFYRAPLYPLLILGARGLVGPAWPGLIVALQLGLAFAATVAFHRALLALTSSRVLAVLGALAQATSYALVTHLAILADSLYASLLCLAFSLATVGGMRGGLRPGAGLVVGGLLGLGTLLREVGAYAGLLWLPLIAAAAAPRPAGAARTVAAALVPMLAAVAGILVWNRLRTGEVFLSTVGQIVYFQALLPLARRGLPVFAGEPALAAAAADAFRAFTIPELNDLSIGLFTDHGLDALGIARLGARTWRRAWIAHPAAMALTALGRIRAHHFLTLFLPIENAATIVAWASGTAPLPARFDRLARAAMALDDAGLALLALLVALCRLVAAGLAVAYLLVPVRALRLLAAGRLHADRAAPIALAAWPLLPATMALHALVHLEIRYFAPALPMANAAALWWIARLVGSGSRDEQRAAT